MDSPQAPLYVKELAGSLYVHASGSYPIREIEQSRNLVIHDANGEVFRIEEDGTLVGDLDAAIAVALQHVRGFVPALRAIQRLRG